MRPIPHWIKVSVITLLSLGAIGAVLLYVSVKYLDHRGDFSKDSPDQVFQMVFDKSTPTSTTVVRASGRHSLHKKWVWMKLQVNPERIDPFLNQFVSSSAITGQDALQEIRRNYAGHHRYADSDQKWVGWNDVYRISRPEVYRFAHGPPLSGKEGWLWIGMAIVDRQRNLVFVHAVGD